MIGERIKAAMELNGWTQRELANKLGVTQVTISRYITGLREPKIPTIMKLSKALGVTISYLIGYSDNPLGEESPNLPKGYLPTPTLPICTCVDELKEPPTDRCFIAPPEQVELHPNALYVEVPDDRINRKVPCGYIAMVDVGIEKPKAGAIHCVAVDGALVFGILHELFNGFELAPLSYDPTARPVVVDYAVSKVDKLGIVIRATMPDWYEL